MPSINFVVAVQTCAGQIPPTLRLLDLMWDLHAYNPWPDDVALWIVYNQEVNEGDLDLLSKSIRRWPHSKLVRAIDSRAGWPAGPNCCWETMLREASTLPGKVGIFGVEPDCIPLSRDWVHQLKAEWESSNKLIIGHMESENGNHINGNAIYDSRLIKTYPTCTNFPANFAYDWCNSALFNSVGKDTNLIVQDYHFGLDRKELTANIFEAFRKNGTRPVWFHGVKTDSGVDIAQKVLIRDAQLFMRTWENDLSWLEQSLLSTKKFWKSGKGITIVGTPECKRWFEERAALVEEMKISVYYEPKDSDGRRGSQFILMHADRYTDSELITFLDSDCMWHTPTSPTDLTSPRGAPIIWMEKFENLHRDRPQDSYAWTGYNNMIKGVLGYEFGLSFMERHPELYYRATIKETREYIEARHKTSLFDVMSRYPSNIFSEFNVLGASQYVLPVRELDRYVFAWRHQGKDRCHQFHSWTETPNSKRDIVNRILSV